MFTFITNFEQNNFLQNFFFSGKEIFFRTRFFYSRNRFSGPITSTPTALVRDLLWFSEEIARGTVRVI